MALPAEMPKIDFNAYKARVTVPGMVDGFQKQYETLTIPYPEDTYSGLIDAQQKEAVSTQWSSVFSSEGFGDDVALYM